MITFQNDFQHSRNAFVDVDHGAYVSGFESRIGDVFREDHNFMLGTLGHRARRVAHRENYFEPACYR